MKSDSKFCSVVRVIYNNSLREQNSGSWIQPRISYSEIRELNAINFVDQWRDESFLFECDDLSYELLIPNYLTHIQNSFPESPGIFGND